MRRDEEVDAVLDSMTQALVKVLRTTCSDMPMLRGAEALVAALHEAEARGWQLVKTGSG